MSSNAHYADAEEYLAKAEQATSEGEFVSANLNAKLASVHIQIASAQALGEIVRLLSEWEH
jgi:hypothetical protein